MTKCWDISWSMTHFIYQQFLCDSEYNVHWQWSYIFLALTHWYRMAMHLMPLTEFHISWLCRCKIKKHRHAWLISHAENPLDWWTLCTEGQQYWKGCHGIPSACITVIAPWHCYCPSSSMRQIGWAAIQLCHNGSKVVRVIVWKWYHRAL